MQNKGVLTIGALLIFFGLLFLLTNIGILDLVYMWPIIPFFIGIGFVLGYLNSRKDYGLLLPASILIIISVLFFYCSVAGWWRMGDLWPIFILAPSCGFFLMYLAGPKDKGLLVPAFILLAIGLVFLMINTYLGIFWPILLIVVGLLLIGINLIKKPATESTEIEGLQEGEVKADKTEIAKPDEQEQATGHETKPTPKKTRKKTAKSSTEESNKSE